MPVLNMVEAIRATLAAEMTRDERIILLGQDIGFNGGMFRATEGLQGRFGEDRVIDMPLAEGVIIGSAVGLACSGLRPVPELQFLGFGSQAFHQIEGQVARMRFRSQGRFPMPMVIRAPFGGNVRTPELHSDAHEAKYANVPGLKIAMPATAADAKGLLTAALHEGTLTSGFGAEVVATIQEEAFWSLEAPVGRVTAPDTPYPIAGIEEHYVPDAGRVMQAIKKAMEA